MKCVCGYVQEKIFPMVGIGVYTDDVTASLLVSSKRIPDHELHKSTVVFICPKCGTLKMMIKGEV